jgi:hypothetical protein
MRPRKLTRTWVFGALGAVFNAPCCWAVNFLATDEPGIALVAAFFLMLIGGIAGALLGASLGHMLSQGTEEWPRTEGAGRWGSSGLNLGPDRDPDAIQVKILRHKDANAIQEERISDTL